MSVQEAFEWKMTKITVPMGGMAGRNQGCQQYEPLFCLAAANKDRRTGTHKGSCQSGQQWPSVESRVWLDQCDWNNTEKIVPGQPGNRKERVLPFFLVFHKIYWEDANNRQTGVFELQVLSWVIYIHSGECDTCGGLDCTLWQWNLQKVPET